MHATAEKGFQALMHKHVPQGDGQTCIDIGSYNVNGSLRPMVEAHGYSYIGVDIREGPGVDYVMPDPYHLPAALAGDAFDLIVTSSCLEHCVNPFRLMRDVQEYMLRGGLIVIQAPFNWQYHPHPEDYYRYSHEGLAALCTEVGLEVVECFMNEPKGSGKRDAFCVARKV